MAEWNIKSPLLADMQILECLSDIGGVATYLIKHEPTGQNYIFKAISIPASQTQVEGLRYSGAIQTAGEAQAYYENVVIGYRAELKTLQWLSGFGSIDCYKASHIQPKEEAVGFDIHLVTEYRQTLAQYMLQTPMTHLKAANLAMDLCTALSDLRSAGYIHCNIKPENIYLNNQGHFMLGDLGLYRADQLKYAAVPERMLGKFTAPELFDVMKTPNTTVDLYTVGLILYSIYNGGHSPFEDERTSAKGASEKRISGTPLPAPIYADYEMASILLKACAFDPDERYQTPDELKEALRDYAQRNEPQDSIIVPPIVTDEDTQLTQEAMEEEIQPVQFASVEDLGEEFVEHFSPDTEGLDEILETIKEELAQEDAETPNEETTVSEESAEEVVAEEPADINDAEPSHESDEEPEEKKEKKKVPFWVWIAAGAVVLAGLAVASWFWLVPNVTAIHQESVTTQSIVLSLDANYSIEHFSATCTDTYGNTVRASLSDGNLVFDRLAPGTQYTVRIDSAGWYPIRGEDTILCSTAAATEVLLFGAKPVSETQVELYFTIAGQDQEKWMVQYGVASHSMIQEVEFTGHSTVISDLLPDSSYVFTLMSTSDIALTGNVQLKYDTSVRTTIQQLMAQTTAEGVTLAWEYTGETPDVWTAVCRGSDGFLEEQTVTEPTVTFAGLEKEKVYTVEIYCSGMAIAAEKTIRTADATVSSMTIAENEDGGLILSWITEDEVADGWQVICTLADDPTVRMNFETTQTQIALVGLLPKSKYHVEVQTGSGMAVNGESSMTIETPASKTYSANGVTSTYVGLFLAPQAENWTYRNLASNRSSFSANETIAFALESLTGVWPGGEEISVNVVVKNTDGIIDSIRSHTTTWDVMWDNNLFVGTPKQTPQNPGSYTLEIYFNGALAGKANFKLN